MSTFKHILVAVDFEECSNRALELAIELVGISGASLTLLHVYYVPVDGYPDLPGLSGELQKSVEEVARKELDRTLATARTRIPGAAATLRWGPPAVEILEAVKVTHPDLVVVGTHGRRGIPRTLLGSVAEKVVRLSPVPVLVAHRCATDTAQR
jgi:nucleotide-binding universal stress UspA family protein